MKEKALGLLSVFTSIFAALCWTGGILLAPLGLGALGTAYFSNMTKYKPLFTIITGILIYWAYTIIEKKNPSKRTKIFFWITAILSILILYSPTILGLLKVL